MTDANRASSSAPASPGGASPPPIAIVGIGCRFPGGVTDVESFWRLLCDGRDAIREVPADRWSVARYHDASGLVPGTSTSRWGGFLDTLKEFDAPFWGLSPREAARMDPQQRWLLEVAWEAIEDSGTAPSRLAGANVGVFVGIAGNDYGGLQLQDPEHVDAYTNSGNTASIASNRVSYMLDLRGPSLSVDTACSSSLVAVWTACSNIWSGACVSALAGGVNALISPQVTIGFSKAAMLSPDGRCFAFDARGNGYVRAEGAGMVFLKPLDRAIADGDRIYAVIRGAAVNQDGRTSSMTVPSTEGQSAMLHAAYTQAGIDPSYVAYVEAHGTGTPVGDPIEATALGRVIGARRAAGEACPIGSVKTNIGHLEAASGIAGLIKAALVAERGWIPASLNYERPNPAIPFPDLGLRVEHCGSPLSPCGGERAIVGVNSFGFGGTNAHVVLQAPPMGPEPTAPGWRAIRPHALAISARDDEALRVYVRRYRALLSSTTSEGIADLCAAAGQRKEQHSQRLVLIGNSARSLDNRARDWLRDGRSPGVIFGRAAPAARPVFVFTGQGAQWWAMGRELIAREPIVRRTVEQVDAGLQPFRGWSLLDEMRRDETQSRIDRTDIAQPALFALQIALAELWRSWGVEPAAVVGHSVGEVAAAFCAGIYTLDEAIAIIHHRSELQQRTQGLGGMLAAAIPVDAARELMAAVGGVELAAVNSPVLVTLSGEHAGLDWVSTRLTRDGIYNRWLRIEYAFHSRQMDPLRDELLDRLRDIRPGAPTVPFYSTVTGSALAGDALDARYWWDNVRQPVLFAPAAAALVRDGRDVFLELGPHPALESSLKDALAAAERTGTVLHSLRRDADDSEELLTNLAALHVAGAAIDWTAVNQASGAVVRLPQYPWNRETYWAEPPAVAERRTGEPVHPLLGMRVDAVQPTWQAAIDPRRLRYLADHRVWGRAVFPAAGFSEMAFAVAVQLFPGERHRVETLEIPAALMLPDEPTVVQTVFDPGDRTVSVHSRSQDGAWQLHARGRIAAVTAADVRPVCEFERLRASGEQHSHERYRAECVDRGYQFGRTFQQIRRLWCDEREGVAEIVVPDEINAELDAYTVHPAVLDACFQSFLGLQAAASATPEGTLLLPHSIERLAVHRPIMAGRLLAFARLVSDEGDTLIADIRVALPDGTPVADIAGFCLARVEEHRPDSLEGCFYRFEWVPRHLRGAGARGSCGFAASARLVEAVAAASDPICANSAFDDYRRESGMRRATFTRLIVNALRELGWQPARGEQVTLSGLVEALGITGEHTRITRVLVGELVHAGWLQERESDRWEIVGAVPEPIDAAAELDGLELAHPASAIDLSFARRTGLRLAGILAGEIDPITLLFPDGSSEIVEQLYAHGSGFAAHLETFRVTLAHALAALPKDRSLRVLEVGAGTGTLTRTVLSVVPAHRTEYLFTDIGQTFLAAAQARFTGHPFIEYRVFDLERDPASQGIPTGHFDLVVASNVLHATADLRQTLAHVRQTLAPGGLLLFLEVVSAEWALANITFGLLKGWWRVTDGDLRPASPWIGRALWLELLADAGFRDVGAVTCTMDPTQSEHATLIAFAPDSAADVAAETARAAGGGTYLVLADEGGVGDAVAARLAAGGHRCTTIRSAGVHSIDEVSRAIEGYANDASLAGVVHCWSLDNPAADEVDLESMQAAQTGLFAGYSLVRRLRERTTPVWFVTRDAASAANGDRVDGLAAAPLTGLARVANNEHQCRFTVIDLDSCSTDEAAACLCDEMLLPRDGEFEIAYRESVRHVLRLTPTRPDAFAARTLAAVKADGRAVPFRLQTSKPGILANLALHETTRSDPRAGEIEVRVLAGGINFRDVMKALGTHPGHPIDVQWFGDDFAGVVERVGEGVETLRPGDEVAGMAPYAFRSFVTTDARMAFAKPLSISFEAAATLPTAFLTAHYALNELARLQPGERVLIHAAAGGVGQAAMQVARASGLEIFATAGTPEKRQMLRDIGAAHVMSSRSLEFADEIMDVTRGGGVDAVLNSLSGDFIPKSLSVLAPFGRFLEIGKVDIYRNARIGLRPLRNNISYFVIDLTQHLRAKPDLIARLFGELACRFSSGVYRPLPLTVFPIANVVDAFRHMAQGRHVGKNVLAFDSRDVKIAHATEPGQRFRGDATYLITGGNGGFGLEVAKWIAREGGRHLVLVSRSGPRDPEAKVAIEDLRSDGIDVVDARGDVARPEDIDRIVTQIRNTMPPLAGVFHAAMVLDDELVADLDDTRIRRVLDPKLAGGWNLHRATVACELDHFVCFSSFSAMLALPKQSNYNAGNVFLDQLAHYRRARGLPAVSINFGALAGAGYVERELKTSAALTRLGAGTFGVDEALRVLERVLIADAAQVGAARVDWERIQPLTPLVAASNTYRPVRMSHDTTDRQASIVTRLRAASDEQRAALIEGFIASQVAAVFGTAADRIDRSASLSSLGLDSLMVLELTNRLERELSFRIPMGTLLGGPTLVELARTVLRLMTPALGEHEEAPIVASANSRSTASGHARDRADAAPSPAGSGHIVTLRSGGADSPIFAVHPVGGGVAIYSPMAAHLPKGAAVYGVESRMNLGEHDEYGTLDEMVDRYTAAIVDCSDEPYRLLGFSLGGYLAGRIAERLERSGRAVQCVGVIDWDLQDRGSTEAQRDSLIRMAVAAYHFAQADVGLVRPLDERRLHGDISRIVDRILRDDGSDGGERFSEWVLENQLVASPGLEDVTRQHLSRFEQHCGLLAGSLPLPRFAAPLCVWRASHGFGSRLAAWEHPGDHNREHLVEGDHNAVIRPDGLALIGRQMTEFVSSIAAGAIGVERGLPA